MILGFVLGIVSFGVMGQERTPDENYYYYLESLKHAAQLSLLCQDEAYGRTTLPEGGHCREFVDLISSSDKSYLLDGYDAQTQQYIRYELRTPKNRRDAVVVIVNGRHLLDGMREVLFKAGGTN